MRKYVVSRTLDKAEWRNSSLISGDAGAAIKRLKGEAGGEIQVHGSGNLIQTLLKHDLVDEFRLWIFPLVLGAGKRLFGDGTMPRAFRLADSKVSSTGVAIHRYVRAGAVEYGSFEVDAAGSTEELWKR
jgi:dihydrofolate reductase